jgi:iron complex transport system permease protein
MTPDQGTAATARSTLSANATAVPEALPGAAPAPAGALPGTARVEVTQRPRSINRGTPPGRAETPALPPVRGRRVATVLVAMTAALVVVSLISAGSGQLSVPPAQVAGSVLHHLGLDVGPMPHHPRGDAVLWNIRFPRLVMGLLVGAALGMGGAVMQGVFRNPLADPGVIGVSSGAAVGACTVIVFGWTFLGTFTVAATAFATALVTTLLVYTLARRNGRTEVVTLVLMGVAVQAVCGALVAWLLFTADMAARQQIVFWQLGSLNGSRWPQAAVAAPLVLTGVLGSMLLARRLDLLALGENAARHLGVDVEALRLTAIVLVTLAVAAAVSFSGVIGFVGLVVPHVIRMTLGPAHRALLPASALGGALVLTLADLIARTAVRYADLPIGMLTALVGGPFFCWLLTRTRARAGGWG